ncbi:MAG: carboxymuconolactone decarboxylase family protein [Georgenia sp.]
MTTHAHLTTLGRLTPAESPDASREILESAKAQSGMVSNMYAAMANSPGLLGTYRFGYDEFRKRSGFSPAEQEVVFLAISRFNACAYCMGVHSAIADRNTVPTEVTDAIRTGDPIGDPRLQALNAFVTVMTDTRGRPSDGDLAAFLAAGYSEVQVLEIILAIAVKTISNYTNHVFDTPLDAVFARRAWDVPTD